MHVQGAIEAAVSAAVKDISALSGGCIGQVYQVRLADGRRLVAKFDEMPQAQLALEAYMLRYLAGHSALPVPEVIFSSDNLLLMSFLPGSSHFGAAAQEHAAELLAALHTVTGPAFGLEQDTLIGGLPQPNPWCESWLEFFGQQRLIHMAKAAVGRGRLPSSFLGRLDAFCQRLDQWLLEPEAPCLIHGDVWTTNVLAKDGRITGFVDPAIYYAHPEIELAFTTLFGTFGQPFFERYQQLRPLPAGFFETRRDIYNLYPLLVHVRLFGGSYVNSVDQTLRRFGF